MDIKTQEQMKDLMFWQAIFAEDRAKWHKAASAKKWTKKMHTTREEVIKSARIVVRTAEEHGMKPEIVCEQAWNLLQIMEKKAVA